MSAGGNLMKKKDAKKKLSLSMETLVLLSSPELGKIAGAAWSDDSVCPTTTPSNCKPCG
jgi:hypothetical protein